MKCMMDDCGQKAKLKTKFDEFYCSRQCACLDLGIEDSELEVTPLESKRAEKPAAEKKTKVCTHCGSEYKAKYSTQVYCNKACQRAKNDARMLARKTERENKKVNLICDFLEGEGVVLNGRSASAEIRKRFLK